MRLHVQVNGRHVTLGVPIRRPRPLLPPAPAPPRSPTDRELKDAALAAGEIDRKALIRVRHPALPASCVWRCASWPIQCMHGSCATRAGEKHACMACEKACAMFWYRHIFAAFFLFLDLPSCAQSI